MNKLCISSNCSPPIVQMLLSSIFSFFYVTYNSIHSISMTTIGGRNITWRKFGEEKLNFFIVLISFLEQHNKDDDFVLPFFTRCRLFGRAQEKKWRNFLISAHCLPPLRESSLLCEHENNYKKIILWTRRKKSKKNFLHNSTSFSPSRARFHLVSSLLIRSIDIFLVCNFPSFHFSRSLKSLIHGQDQSVSTLETTSFFVVDM